MNDINLKQIITEFPDCITNGAKLKAILLDTYPEASRGVINAILIISNSGIADEIQSSVNIDKIETGRWLKKLENDYCMSGSTVEKCLQLWINAFSQEETIPLLSEKPSATDEEIINAIENDDTLDELCECDIDKYIVYCSYILKNLKGHKGFVYYELAKQLHRYDLFKEIRIWSISKKDLHIVKILPIYMIAAFSQTQNHVGRIFPMQLKQSALW